MVFVVVVVAAAAALEEVAMALAPAQVEEVRLPPPPRLPRVHPRLVRPPPRVPPRRRSRPQRHGRACQRKS